MRSVPEICNFFFQFLCPLCQDIFTHVIYLPATKNAPSVVPKKIPQKYIAMKYNNTIYRWAKIGNEYFFSFSAIFIT